MAISGVNGARQSYRDKFTTTGILDTEKTEGEESTGRRLPDPDGGTAEKPGLYEPGG